MTRAGLLLVVVLLSACAGTRQAPRPPPPDDYKPEPVDPQKVQQIRSDVIRGLLDKGQFYAALAHIEEQKQSISDSSELTWLEAETRRHLMQTAQADALYRRLLGGSLEGRAYHGLGLMYAKTDLDGAIRNLRNAAMRLPTDVEIRNDLGYALMEAGRYTEALPELSTAAELAPSQLKSRNNLIVLMLLTGNQIGADRLAQQSGTTPDTLKALREQAQGIRQKQAARHARTPT